VTIRPPKAPIDPQKPTAEVLLWAYAQGLFPMADPYSHRIDWYSPDPRGIIPLERFHVPKSLARVVRKQPFEIRTDTAFRDAMAACAAARWYDADGLSWIDDRLIDAYSNLFTMGHAHSVEAWLDDDMVGGLYGVQIGAAFFGESMFSRPERGGTNASKVCLVHVVQRMRQQGFELLDTQFVNAHLEQFGCVEIPQDEYLQRLRCAIAKEARWGS